MSQQVGGVYPKVDMTGGSQKFPDMEAEVLKYWEKDNTFQASLDQRKDNEEYVFYDGPPFANGLPHYGHLLTGYVKDIIPRFRTMRGYHVPRVFGWDTHGLPAELEAEKQLGITDKSQIDEMGLAAFNDYCAKSVLRYTQEWKDYVTRQARWVDFENGYKTMDLNYMESVIWAFKQLYDKGLIYQGFRVLPYSWAEHTPLSNQETRLDDSYKMRQDPALTVILPLTGAREGSAAEETWANSTVLHETAALAWTTTPWTLPSNLALAVHPEVNYVAVRAENGKVYLLAEPLMGNYARELGESASVEATFTGAQLEGLEYQPVFDFFADHDNAFQVLTAEYVTTEDGTGVVHQAPAFGEDDMATCAKYDIDLVIPVDMDGKFTELVPPYQGQLVFDANKAIIADLKAAGRVLRHETIYHSYPHSWRSGEPLIYMALPSWFVKVTEIRSRMVELNQEIEWLPEHVRDGQFGKWLENARDWNISRSRYWGSPIPVWQSDNPEYPRTDVYGSLDELERDFGVRPESLHRPYIDELTRPNPDDPTGSSTMRRVTDVLDVWFDSGSMPFAQYHYPFDNKEWFENEAHPSDFIVEYIGQTRGWFYLLHVLSVALFDRPAFKRVVAHGIVLGDDGLKMSKSKGNYPDVNEVFDRDGSDAMRWFLMASPILHGGNLIVTEQGIREGVRQAILPIWNAYTFLQLYSSEDAQFSVDSTDVLDRYILAKVHDLVAAVGDALDASDIARATDEVRAFADVLTNWYIRRSRDRFWVGQEKHPEAFNTLYTVLEVLTRTVAPLLPFISEVVWRGLAGGRSVHLTDYPVAADLPADAELVETMDAVRAVCSAASSVRKANKLRNRLPLPRLTVALPEADRLAEFVDVLRDEVNVKKVELTDDVDSVGRFEVVVNAKVAGPRLGRDVQTAIKAVKSGDYTREGEEVVAGGIRLKPEEFTERLVADDADSTAAIAGLGGLVVLDTTVTEELEAEGWAADVIRGVQDARKQENFEVSDRISTVLSVPADKEEWALRHADHIAAETLSTSFTVVTEALGPEAHEAAKGVTVTAAVVE